MNASKGAKRRNKRLRATSSERPISLESFLQRLRNEVDEFERLRDLPGGYLPRSYNAWFADFVEDMQAPEGC